MLGRLGQLRGDPFADYLADPFNEFGLSPEWNPPSGAGAAGFDTSIKTARQLSQAIANSPNGYISVSKASSAYILATEHGGVFGSFAVKQDPLNPSNYVITTASIGNLAAGGAGAGIAVALVLLIVMSRR